MCTHTLLIEGCVLCHYRLLTKTGAKVCRELPWRLMSVVEVGYIFRLSGKIFQDEVLLRCNSEFLACNL